jgi:hypothetical protein
MPITITVRTNGLLGISAEEDASSSTPLDTPAS